MQQQEHISDIVLIEAAHLLSPLTSLDTPESVIDFLRRIGYEVPVSDLVSALTGLFATSQDVITIAKQLVEAETDEEKAAILLQLIPVVADAFKEINKLSNSIRNLPDLAQDFKDHAPLDELPKRLADYLLFLDLYRRYPKLFGTLLLMGVLDEEKREEDLVIYQPKFNLKKVRWDRIPKYLTNPGEVINEVYKWNTGFDSDLFLERLELFLRAMSVPGGLYKQTDSVKLVLGNTTPDLEELRIPAYSNGIYPEAYMQLGLNLSPAEANGANKKGLALIPYFDGSAQATFDISEDWQGTFSSSLGLDAVAGLVIRPPFSLEAFQNVFGDGSSPENIGTLQMGFTAAQKKLPNGQAPEIFIFGDKENTHISLKDISSTLYAKMGAARKDFGAEVEIKNISVLIDTSDGDSFLNALLPDGGIKASFGLGVGFSLLNGIYFKGSSGIEILIPVHIQLGPIEIQNVVLSIRPAGGIIPIDAGATVKANLGPLKIVVENIGLSSEISFPENGEGNIGPMNMKLKFKPPKGVGLSLDAGIVKGGGYLSLDYDKGLYAGALQLSVQNFLTLNAIGLVSTQLPNGQPGYSMLVIVTTEFMPAFQLGFGFTLIGVGGLLGLNRTVLVEALRDGVQSGALESILFPTDVINNAPRIISDLQEIFPAQPNSFLVGPMAKIGWGTPTLISLSMGLIVQLPNPFIAILGVLKMVLPTEEASILKIQVNFLGTIEPANKLIAFDASLFDSQLAYIITLEGDMVMRLKWGNQPDFILSVGGFHPDYTPTMELPPIDRITISLLDYEYARVQFFLYFAVTSNTAQFGARATAFFGIDDFNVSGEVWFDTLFQFSPFMFTASAGAEFSLNTPLGDAGIFVTAVFRGPAPWYLHATGRIEIWEFDWVVDETFEWGEDRREELPAIEIKPKFIAEFSKPEVWSAQMPTGRQQLISIITPEAYEPEVPTTSPENTPVRIHPFGSLTIVEKLVPLNVEMELFGNQPIADVHKISIQSVAIGTQTANISNLQDFFAVAQFKNLTDDEKLSRPSFEQFNNGVTATFFDNAADFVPGNAVRQSLQYEQIFTDIESVPQTAKGIVVEKLYVDMLNGSASKRSKLSQRFRDRLRKSDVPPADPNAGVSYSIGNAMDNSSHYSNIEFDTVTAATDAMSALIRNNPALKGNLVLIEQN